MLTPSHPTGIDSIPVHVPAGVWPATREPVPIASPPATEVKALHVVNGEHFSGAERVQSHLGRCLPQFGVAADFVCVKPGRFASMLGEHQGRWGQGFEAPMQHRLDLRAALNVRDLVRAHSYDLLHAHTPRTAMITAIAARLTDVPWIYHVHSPAARDSERRWSNRVNDWIERLSLRSCSHRITVSESLRRDLIRQGADPDSVSVVHNGVPSIRPVRNHVPVPGEPWTLGMVALMRPRKGLEVVLEALAMVRNEGHEVGLRCIGPFETEEYEREINQRIERLGLVSAIERQGFTADVPAALGRLDAMVLPSLYGEGLPMVVLEAMAAGLPVIATQVEGTPEAITHGVEGLLAAPQDPVSLADQIRSLILGEHDWSAMADAAVRRHRQGFSDVAMAEKTAAIYRRVLARSTSLNQPCSRSPR